MNNEKIMLSVIIPCYNGEQCLPHLMEQVCAENLDNVEIIVINDGSTDGTEKVCKSFAEKNEHIQFVTTENHGVSSARNLGLEKARGEYITFFDADDEIMPWTISLYKQKVTSQEDVYAFNYETLFVENDTKRSPLHLLDGKYDAEKFLRLFLYRRVSVGLYSLVLKKSFLSVHIITFDTKQKFGEDYLFILSVLLHSKTVSYDDSIVYRYLINAQSVSNKINYDIRRFYAFMKIKELVDQEFAHKKQLQLAKNFFLADLYAANVQIYLCGKETNKEFEQYALHYKKVLLRPIVGSFKYCFRIWFFALVPLSLLFLIKRGRAK